MSVYVLIHGSWHGAWCWDKVVPLLESKGHQIVAPDLPAHGNDQTPVSEVTFQSYVNHICQVLDRQVEAVILVAHSSGGIFVSQAAEERSHQIKTLVFLAGFLPRNGESLRQLSQRNTESLLGPNRIVDEARGVSLIKQDSVKEVFYHDCSDEDVARAKSLLCPEPLAPGGVPVSLTEENFGRIPRVYIECVRDKTLWPALQKEMYTAVPCQRVVSLETSHSPFFSAPEKLVEYLSSVQAMV
jgi:pimeloyl-ACP methyl ester carboxylesterase